MKLQCPAPRSTNAWTRMASDIKDKATLLKIDPILSTLLCQAVSDWRTTIRPPRPASLPIQYDALFQAQSKIGWNEILNGRLCTQWSTQQALFSNHSSSHHEFSRLISFIFSQLYTIWKSRCDAQHGTTQTDIDNKRRYQLIPQVQALYDSVDQLDPIDRQYFRDPTIESITKLPVRQLEHWISRTTKLVHTGIKRAKFWATINTRSIRDFFQPTVTPNSTTIPQPDNSGNPSSITRRPRTRYKKLTLSSSSSDDASATIQPAKPPISHRRPPHNVQSKYHKHNFKDP